MLAVSAAHVQELGAVIGLIGALVIAYGAFGVIGGARRRSPEHSRRTEKVAYLVGALIIALAFVIQIVAVNIKKPTPIPTPSLSPSPSPSASTSAAIGSASTTTR